MYKRNIIKYLEISFVGIILSLILLNAPEIGFCVNCYGLADVGQPLSLLFLSLVVIFTFLFFAKKMVFTTWKKFAIPYLIFSTIILLIPSGGMGGFMGGGPDNEFFAIILSGLFLIISLLIIAIKSWKLRKMNSAE
ncbi:hypothetical protein ACFLY0_02360 [Patescibacteria group bacterium]